jgi:flagellar motor component MotA
VSGVLKGLGNEITAVISQQKKNAMTAVLDSIEIHVTSRRALDERLDDAVKTLQELAICTRRQGILVARNKPGHYTAALSDQVPFGVTPEVVR